MTTKRYELLPAETEGIHAGLHRIRALVDIPQHGVRAGDPGGLIKSEDNLRQDGTGWVRERGVIWGGVIWGGVIWGGVIRGGDIWGGVIRGGVIRGGDIRGGDIRGGDILERPGDNLYIANPTPNAEYAGLTRTKDGYRFRCGCWEGTIPEFRTMVNGDTWPSGGSEEYRAEHRPWLLAIADLFEVRAGIWEAERAAAKVSS